MHQNGTRGSFHGLGETWRRGVYMTFSLCKVTLEPLPSRQLPDCGVGRAQSSPSSG